MSFLQYLVTPATKATGPKPKRWLAFFQGFFQGLTPERLEIVCKLRGAYFFMVTKGLNSFSQRLSAEESLRAV